jgi:hypothetical protein
MHKFKYRQFDVNIMNTVRLVAHFPRSVTFKNSASDMYNILWKYYKPSRKLPNTDTHLNNEIHKRMEQTNTTIAGRNNTLSGQISWDKLITDCWQNVYSVATITLITEVYFDIWCTIRVHITNVCGITNDI